MCYLLFIIRKASKVRTERTVRGSQKMDYNKVKDSYLKIMTVMMNVMMK